MFLPRTFIPTHSENRMKSEGELEKAREYYLAHRPNNLSFLLKKRFGWMNKYIEGKEKVYELGAGAGFSKLFIKSDKLVLTDIVQHSWIDQEVDALNLPFEDNSVDVFICSHMIHHVAQPLLFLENLTKKLKKGGMIVVSEATLSYLLQFLMLMMKHEGWNYNVDVFNKDEIANDPKDPWSANCAIPDLLWSDKEKFENAIPSLKVAKYKKCECFIFPLSGGVIAKAKTIPLPMFALKLVDFMDSVLITLFPKFFAMGLEIVLEKKD